MDQLNITTSLEKNSHSFTGISVYMIFLFIFGLLEHFCVFTVFIKYKPIPISNSIFILALTCVDFIFTIFPVPFLICSSLSGSWIYGHVGCVFYGFLMTFLGISQIAILVIISVDKYLIIVQQTPILSKERRARTISLMSCFGFGLMWGIFPLLGWSSYELEGLNISCSVHWTGRTWSSVSYSLSLMTFAWFVPVLVISFCYGSILVMLRKEARKPIRKRLGNGQRKNKSNREKSVAITVLVMIGAFVVSWMPYSIVSLIAVFGDPGAIPKLVTMVPNLFAKASIIWNPVIYLVRHNDFRCACLRLLPACGLLRKICHSRRIKLTSKSKKELLTDVLYIAEQNPRLVHLKTIPFSSATVVVNSQVSTPKRNTLSSSNEHLERNTI